MQPLPPPEPQVFLAFPEDYPAADLAAVLADFAGAAALVQVQHTEWLPPTAPAWAAPTAVTASLSAAFVATLRPGAAMPHTPALLAGLQALTRRRLEAEVPPEASAAVPVPKQASHQSEAFSIVAHGQSGQRVKLLFDVALPPAACAAALPDVLPLLAVHYLQATSPAPASKAALAAAPAPMRYLVYGWKRSCWELQSDVSMQALHRKGN